MTKRTWSQEVQWRLYFWFRWAGPHNYRRSRLHPIAVMMRVAAGELPGDDISVPIELTPVLRVTDKAVAQMKREHPVLRQLLMDTYLKGKYLHEMAAEREWTEDMTKAKLWQAESMCGRYMITVEKELFPQGLAFAENVKYHRRCS